MLEALLIVLDGDFERPLYADPEVDDLDDEVLGLFAQTVEEVADGEQKSEGTRAHEEWHLGWKVLTRLGLAFCAVVTDDVPASEVTAYLNSLSKRYTEEVDDARSPDEDGLEDIVVDVIPPWEE